MTELAPADSPIIEWGWAGRGLEQPSGDLHAVVPFPGGVLCAVIDGLGHGHEAALASRAAASVMDQQAAESPLLILRSCHEALRRTRGAVMSLASFRVLDSSLTWLGVGNVDGVLMRAQKTGMASHEAIGVRSGVVGYQLPPLRADVLSVSAGDTLILATDGIRSGFTTGLAVEHAPQEIAESILARFAKNNDDALVLVARYLGDQA
jgi:negative regulator of sigma-B (phosphoserine phosphatase)